MEAFENFAEKQKEVKHVGVEVIGLSVSEMREVGKDRLEAWFPSAVSWNEFVPNNLESLQKYVQQIGYSV